MDINVFDTVTVGFVAELPLDLDSVVVVEDVGFVAFRQWFITANDVVVVTEAVPVLLHPIQLAVGDTVTLVEFVDLPDTLLINLFDTVAVGDTSELGLVVADTVLVQDFETVILGQVIINVFDGVTAAEFTDTVLLGAIASQELVTVTESVTVKMPLLAVADSSVTAAESPAVVYDEVTVVDGVEVAIPGSPLALGDDVTIVSDFVVMRLNPMLFDLAETVTVADVPTLSTWLSISVNEEILAEELQGIFGNPAMNEFDTVTVADTLEVLVSGAPLAISQDVSVSDVVTVLLAQLRVTVNDVVTLAESASAVLGDVSAGADTFTEILVLESLTLAIAPLTVGLETVTLAEEIEVGIPPMPVLFEGVVVAEAFDLYLNPIFVNEFEAVAVTEDMRPRLLGGGAGVGTMEWAYRRRGRR